MYYTGMINPLEYSEEKGGGLAPPYSGDKLRRVNRYIYHPKGLRYCAGCSEAIALTTENFGVKRYYEGGKVGLDSLCRVCMVGKRANINKGVKADYRRYCSSKLLSQLRHRAKSAGLDFNLDGGHLISQVEDQGFLCYYTGEPLDFSLSSNGNYPHRKFPSLDRVDPRKGYTKGNVVWCTYEVNRMKNDLTEKELLEMCSKILGRRQCTIPE